MDGPLTTSARLSRARRTTTREYLVRFAFGGLVTVGAGLVGQRWGPVAGGLFLAFPSILPASLTLVARHARLPAAAGADAFGASVGSLGLVGFGALLWALAATLPAWLVLPLAALVWLAVAVGSWTAFELWHQRRHQIRVARLSSHRRASQPGGAR